LDGRRSRVRASTAGKSHEAPKHFPAGTVSSGSHYTPDRMMWKESSAGFDYACPPSFERLVDAGKQRGWKLEAKHLRGLEVDRDLELGWQLDGKIGGLRTAQDAIDIGSHPAIQVDGVTRRYLHIDHK